MRKKKMSLADAAREMRESLTDKEREILDARLARAMPLVMKPLSFKTAAEKLWALLDDIDTLDDQIDEDAPRLFRERVREVQKKRHEIATSEDGQTLVWKK